MSRPDDFIVLDAPPGTACAAREAMTKADVVLLVAEPTPFGLHDLKLACRLAKTFDKKRAVVVNRQTQACDALTDFCAGENLPVTGVIPYRAELAAQASSGDLDIGAYPEIRAEIDRIAEWLLQNAEQGAVS
jgi:MinD superfamily P-loop ATPase